MMEVFLNISYDDEDKAGGDSAVNATATRDS
jgi:hypothetical protein